MEGLDSAKIAAFSAARREAWGRFLGAALIVALIFAAAALLSAGHIGLVADTLIVTLCLIPMLIVMLPIFVGVLVGIRALAGADKAAVSRLIQAERAAAAAKTQAQEGGVSVGRRVIALAASVERLEPLWRIFDRKPDTKGHDDAAQSAK